MMRCKKTLYALIMIGATLICTIGCGAPETIQTDTIPLSDTSSIDNMDSIAIDTVPLPEEEPLAAQEPKSQPIKHTQPRKEKIYVRTFGAQGEVWGYVTMTGNKGRGTIYDQNENVLSVSVTRHGNELYGTDQNGRRYVFPLQ